MADATSSAVPAAPTTAPAADPAATTDDGKGGKSAVLADLAAERDKRQALEAQVATLTQNQQTQTAALANAFGLKPEETSDVSALASQVPALQEHFAASEHQNLVLTVANAHGISDTEAIADLSSVKDEQAMRRLAGRIQATAAAPGAPRPDLSQGGKDAPVSAGPAADFANFMQRALNN
jgi:hypothetical protein